MNRKYQNPIKILYISPLSKYRNHGKGGVETATENILDGFSQIRDLQLTVLSFNDDYFEDITTQYSKNVSLINVGSKTNFISNIINQRKYVKNIALKVNPDLIHIHGIGPQIFSLGSFPKKNVVITQHGINRIELKYQTTIKNYLKFLIKSAIESFYLSKFENYIFISQSNYNYIEENFKFSGKNYSIIGNAVGINFFDIPQKDSYSNHILYIGFISRLKNLILLLKVIKKLASENKIYKLSVVGSVKDSNYYDECKEFVRSKKLEKQVWFKGFLNQDEVRNLYKQVDIFVLPSLQENSPISILEAMAAGKAVIASNVGGISEIINDEKNGLLIEQNSFDDLYGHLSELYNNPKLINKMGSLAKKYVKEHNSPKIISNKLFDYYEKTIQK